MAEFADFVRYSPPDSRGLDPGIPMTGPRVVIHSVTHEPNPTGEAHPHPTRPYKH